ncbi:MAG: hypothetical protein FD155_1813 [Bacteroidetes bacterium]|nr:MAG: hypothetical protein FD155_1813 [Bacteroidota bacterium]
MHKSENNYNGSYNHLLDDLNKNRIKNNLDISLGFKKSISTSKTAFLLYFNLSQL